MPKINISFIMYAGLSYGGAHRQAIRLACALDKEIFNVRYFWCRHNKDIGSPFVFPELDFDNIKLMEKSGVDVIEFNVKSRDIRRPLHPWYKTDFFKIYGKYKTDIVFSARAGYPEYPFYLIDEPIVEWNIFGSADFSKNLVYSISQSPWVQKKWLKNGGKKEKNKLIYPFVPAPANDLSLRKELKISKEKIIIGFHQRKDDNIFGEHALRAYAGLDSKIKNKTQFIIVGGSDKYKKLDKELGTNVIFLPIAKEYRQVSMFLNTLDIFAHSGGAGETLCIAIQEAMMHKVPAISLDIQNCPNAQADVMDDTGFMCDNIAEYTKIMQKLIENDKFRNKYSLMAYLRAKSTFSEESCITSFTSLFQDIYKRQQKRYKLKKQRIYMKKIPPEIHFLYLNRKSLGRLFIKALNKKSLSHLFIKALKHINTKFFQITNTFYLKKIKGSYSQYGEDLIINKLLDYKTKGVYLDIGANDPDLLNNTKFFYNKGWSGVNIEPNKTLFDKLSKYRTRDKNLNIGLGPKKDKIPFYEMSEDTLSTFSKEDVFRMEKEGYKIKSTKKVQVLPLKDIFNKHLYGVNVDFLSIDVEGFEIEVLKSNDWSKFRASLIIVEINHKGEEIMNFLEKNNYSLVYKNHTNGIFSDKFLKNKKGSK